MAEQTFKSPGFFEREIEVIKRPFFRNTATPVGLVGPSLRGPAFVPTTVSSREEFIRIFGAPQRKMLSGHAMAEFFRNDGKALTFCRTLGTGHLSGSTVQKAGFKMVHTEGGDGVADKKYGAVHFLAAKHQLANAEFLGLGSLTDNDSHTTDMDSAIGGGLAGAATEGVVELIRAVIFTSKDNAVFVSPLGNPADYGDDVAAATAGVFKIKIEDNAASRTLQEFEVSLDPDSPKYISKVLNTDPLSMESKGHFLYAHFPVDTAVADVAGLNVAILHGADAYDDEHFGDFSSKFKTPETPKFISQPFGKKEYDLFHFESLDDGAYASSKYKISISNLRASTDPTDDFGTFTVSVRDLRDTDESPIVYETFGNCSLNPQAENFIGRVIGDQKVFFNSDVAESERRLVREGLFPNVSTRVRVVLSDDVMREEIPQKSLPFGFRGVPSLILNAQATDAGTTLFAEMRDTDPTSELDHAVLPPLPYRFKVTKGDIRTGSANVYAQTFTGQASDKETVDLSLHWGLMPNRVSDINNANGSSTDFNEILENYTKFMGKSTTVVATGTIADSHNNNKFSLAKVSLNRATLAEITGSITDVFKDAVYVRNADADKTTIYNASTHEIIMTGADDAITGGSELDASVSLAKLLAEDPSKFNRYSLAAKFTAPFSGGFDGLNIFDSDSFFMTDKGLSTEVGGHSSSSGFASALKDTDAADKNNLMQGYEDNSNVVASFKNAIRLMTDDLVVNHNVLVLPGVRDPFITDFAKSRVEDYGKALYVMDVQQIDKSGNRVFVDAKGTASGRADVDQTSSTFDAREVNSSYVASYFPDAMVQDSGDDDAAAVASRRSVRVPASVVALGALAKNDSITSPWFAPAGFSRGALETITSIDVRLNAEDRDTLYEARINPIANFPNRQFVIFGQKTSQLARTALDRVNVRRLVLEVKRRIEIIAQGLLFEQNNKATRDRFIASASTQLSDIQINRGIEDFRVVMDNTNNSSEDVDNNRLNGKIVIVPTRAVEFIAIDFVITNAGVEFP